MTTTEKVLDGDVWNTNIPILLHLFLALSISNLFTPNTTTELREWSIQVFRASRANNPYYVHAITHLKRHRAFPSFQHEYVVLELRWDPGYPVPQGTDTGPHIVCVSRRIEHDGFCSWLKVYGTAQDTISILTTQEWETKRTTDLVVHSITWPDHRRAPSLQRFTNIFALIQTLLPTYCLLKTSCYPFTRSIMQAAHRINGEGGEEAQQHRAFTRRSFFIGLFPVGIRRSRWASQKVADYFARNPALP